LEQGRVTPSLLREMSVPHAILPDYPEGAFEVLETAYAHMARERTPFALLVKRQTFQPNGPTTNFGGFSDADMLHREEVLQLVMTCFSNDLLVTTTGFTSREVFELRKANGQSHAQDFLTVGSMGHCSSIALGVANALRENQGRQVLCVDGDGAVLMHMGSLPIVGNSGQTNLKHIIINNAMHDSVGGQPTCAGTVDFPAIALACGYRTAGRERVGTDIPEALRKLRECEGPALLELQVLPGSRADLGRPTTSTHENRDAFIDMLRSGEDGPLPEPRN